MYFRDRADAGKLLSLRLTKFQNLDAVVYALPRGGVVVGVEIADLLHIPLDVILTRKIGHPDYPEYAIAAISESGQIATNPAALSSVDLNWLGAEKERQEAEIKRRRLLYSKGKEAILAKGKIAIIVDDGIATGLTMQAAILELKEQQPKKIIVVVPVAPKTAAELLQSMVDEFFALEIPEDSNFLGAVGSYYHNFIQVEDAEVIRILEMTTINYTDD